MNTLLIFLAGGLLTFAIRFSFMYLMGRMNPPEGLRRALQFVPAAVLSAIAAPELLLHSGSLDVSLDNARLIAGIVAMLVAWRTRNMLVTILAGYCVLLLLQLTL